MKHLLFFTVLLVLSLPLQSAERYNFTSLDVSDGVPDNYIHEILRDGCGFMWFISGQTLTRYDGHDFKNYDLPVPGWHAYYKLNKDKYGNIWVRVHDSYFFYDRIKDRLNGDLSEVIDYPDINSGFLFFDVDYDGNLWFSQKEGEIVRYGGKSDIRQYVLPEGSGLKRMESRNGKTLFLFSEGEVYSLADGSSEMTPYTSIPFKNERYVEMYFDADNVVWFYVAHSAHGNLISYDERTSSLNGIRDSEGQEINFVTDVVDDGKGNLWISTDNSGIIVYDKEDGTNHKLVKDQDEKYSIPSSHVECLYLDFQDMMWVGTSKRGISYTCLNEALFKKKDYPGVDEVSCVVEDSDGNIWYGTDGNGIVCDVGGSGRLVRYNTSNSGIPGNLIVCAFTDSKGRVWFGTYGSGLFYYEKGRFVRLKANGQADDRHIRDVNTINEDAYGNIWIGTNVSGLFCYETDGSLSSYSATNSEIYSNGITHLYCGRKRILYVATASGLFAMDTYTRTLSDLTISAMGFTEHFDAVLTCICKDSRGLLWCGGKNGLRVYNETNGQLTVLDGSTGLSHDYVKGICEDRNGNMWLTTDVGLTNIIVVDDPVMPIPKFRCIRYYDEDGLYDIMFYPQAIRCLEDGEVVMGGIGGLIATVPVQKPIVTTWSDIQFTDLNIAGRRVAVGEEIDGKVILRSNIQTSGFVELDYSNNSFSISVSSLNFPSMHKEDIMYRLEGHTDWMKLNGNLITFNKLQSGTYNLQVKIADLEELPYNTASMTIRIKPPVWKSNVAYVLYALISILLIGLLVHRIRQKTKMKYRMRILDMNISHQKEMDEAQMRFFTNISHDLRTPLSLVITPLEKLLSQQNLDSRLRNDLKGIHNSAQELMDEVNQLLDFRKLDNGMSSLNLSHGSLSDLVKEVCKSFKPYSVKHKVRLNLVMAANDIKMTFDKDKMKRILVNLLSNAYKFNMENGSITVSLEIITENGSEMVRLAVADTGMGIPDQNKALVFDRFYQVENKRDEHTGSGIGLNIVKEFVRMHGGTVSVKDNQPKGTVFILVFPYDKTDSMETVADPEFVSSGNTDEGMHPLLLVEDNDKFRRFMVECLQDRFPLLEASNGKEAMAILKKQSVSMVISDVMMPKMNGLELCRNIKNDIRFSHIPVILLTAKTADDNVIQGLKEGCDDYVTKPFNIDVLMLRITRIMEWSQSAHSRFKTVEVSPSEITITSLDEQLISKAIRIVEDNMSNMDFSVDDLSSAIGMTRGHLYKKLMAITGKAPLEFIRTIRIKRGRQLLEKSQLGVADIAYRVGLSPKQFSKYFKEMFGKLPSDYKRTFSEEIIDGDIE